MLRQNTNWRDLADAILDKVPLVSLIGEKVVLKTVSGRAVGLCPYHAEKTPSFYVYEKNYYCFGCKAYGDAISYIRNDRSLSFFESIKYLAKNYQIDISRFHQGDTSENFSATRTNQLRLLDTAYKAFVDAYAATEGSAAQDYVQRRQLLIYEPRYGFGYAPNKSRWVISILEQQGYHLRDIKECGLSAIRDDDNRPFDFFRNRLIIPIRDFWGRVVGFGGRALGESQPKYLNSRDSSLFNKSELLFGLDVAKEPMRTNARAVVVEGYMDALQMWHHGFHETVACLGTALTLEHLQTLSRITQRLILLLDGDRAGRDAVLRLVDLALNVPMVEITVAKLPDGEDPDSFLRRYGAKSLQDLLDSAEELLAFAINDKLQKSHNLGLLGILQSEIIPWLQMIPDPTKRQFLVSRTEKITQMSLDGLLRQNAPILIKRPPPQDKTPKSPHLGLTPIEFEILAHLFYSEPGELSGQVMPSLLVNIQKSLDTIWQTVLQDFWHLLTKEKRSPATVDMPAWSLAHPEDALALIAKFVQMKQAFTCEDRRVPLAKLLTSWHRQSIRGQIAFLRNKVAGVPRISWSSEENQFIFKTIVNLSKALNTRESPISS